MRKNRDFVFLRSLKWLEIGMMAAMMLAACSKDVADELIGTSENTPTQTNSQTQTNTPTQTNSLLQVRTRGSDETTIGYPIQIYVFKDDDCQAVQTIADADQSISIALAEGTYAIYALGSVSTADYTLPAKDEATPTSAVALNEGRTLTDLMAASAVATLTDGGSNTVTLGLRRKTMLLQDVTIKKVPSAATAVTVTIAPLCQNITVNGSFCGTDGSQTISLTKQSDGRTWKNTASAHLLPPSSQPASISVNVTVGGVTKTYTYSCSDRLETGYKINIDGTYTEAVGVSLTGTITGATWLGERTISFDFDESGSTMAENNDNNGGNNNNDPPDNSVNFPAVGDTYEGCYVLAVTEIDETSAELTLLSPNEQAATTAGDADAALATLGAVGISDWAVPTKAQMQLVEAKLLADDTSLSGQKYLYRKSNDGLGYRTLGAAETAWPTANTTDAYRLRPVAVVSVTTE